MLPSLRVVPGMALDLTTHDENGKSWDFDDPEMRQKARTIVAENKPLMLVGSPICTPWSSWQHINDAKRDPGVVAREKVRARVHLEFICELYTMQVRGGRYFLHEHPSSATSWSEGCLRRVAVMEGVDKVVADQCQYGSTAECGGPVKKPTGFMSNSAEVRRELERRCAGRGGDCSRRGGGRHVVCSGRVARRAAIYPFELCRAILVGFARQMRIDGVIQDNVVGMQLIEEAEEQLHVMAVEAGGAGGSTYRDDLTGQSLDPSLVAAAIEKELAYFESKEVWQLVPTREARRATGKDPVTVRWVHTNKGDNVNPELRARLVARQMRGAHEDPIFAPTPPLEALRTILSLAATEMPGERRHCRDPMSERRMQISLIDISRAYFNAKVDQRYPTYVALPPEHPQYKEGMCGRLLRHMYGTRAAAEGWQSEYSSTMIELGFVQGSASPCVFFHPKRQLRSSVYGDDFTTAGAKADLDWFETALEAKYELRKGGRLGPGPEDEKEGRILNRVVRWTPGGLEYEADPRQCEKLLEETELEGANSVATAGVKSLGVQVAEDKPLPTSEHTRFRSLSARANYLAADRPDCQFAAKEVCRWMASPSELSMLAIKRLCRFLGGRRRLVYRYPFQQADTVECYSDTDWAGCARTRKSTSGGCLMLGGHVLKTWSSTQPTVSLSSGEAEFYGVVKTAGLALGQQAVLRDLGHLLPVRVWTDSSAAIGICSRQGLGKLRHVATHTLWVQDKVRTRAIELRKVRGEVNPADLFTKHQLSKDRVESLVRLFGCEYREGRPDSAPQLRRKEVQQEEQQQGKQQQQKQGRQQQQKQQKQQEVQSLVNLTQDEEHALDTDYPMHDFTILPHQHPADEFVNLFPLASAPDEEIDTEFYADIWDLTAPAPSAAIKRPRGRFERR